MRTVRGSAILLAYSYKDLYFPDHKRARDSGVHPAQQSPAAMAEDAGRASEFILSLSLDLFLWNSFFANLQNKDK